MFIPRKNPLLAHLICIVTVGIVSYSLVATDPANEANMQDVISNSETPTSEKCNIRHFKISGRIHALQHDDPTTLKMSLMNTRILVNHGQYITFPREDGYFEVDNLPSESYVVEVTHPKFVYEAARVDITSKGKIRARQVNHIQPSWVQTMEYPLSFRPKGLHNYFIPRETWRIMDLLLNPMVLMMIVPLIIIWLLPKMMNPEEMQSQRENVQMPEYNVPELSEMMANMFGQKQAGSAGQSNQPGSGSGSGSAAQAITLGASRHSKVKRR